MTPVRRWTLLAVSSAIFLVILRQNRSEYIGKIDNSIGDNIQSNRVFTSPNKTNKTIQWYDSYHNGHGLRMKANTVHMNKCEYKNCELLTHYIVPERDDELHGPFSADAVIFQGCHLGHFLPPLRRDNDQVFVFAERETWWYLGALERMIDPALNKTQKQSSETSLAMQIPDVLKNPNKFVNTFHFRSLFNWTMTYRRDSDIYLPYGSIMSKQSASNKGFIPGWKASEIDNKDYDRVYYSKTRDVVWLVSDCTTKSKREQYVKQLREYINVDIYGGCGNLSCSKQQKFNPGGHNCLSKIVKEYKFILSFENTFHTDYVTEKLFDWFARDIVQVVYGMADYGAITPPRTVINAANFNSPEELAHFMKEIGSDKKNYVQYLKQKDRHFAVGHREMQQDAYCKLCEKLNNLDRNRRTYPNIGQWWQLNDTSGFINLYNQAVDRQKQEGYFLTISIILLIFSCYFIFRCFRKCLYK